MSDHSDHNGGRRALLAGAVTLGGAAAALIARPARAQDGGRASMDTPITDLIYEEDHALLTDRARALTKSDLIELSRLSRGETRLKDGNPLGLTEDDLDSIEEAFWMHDVRDHNLQHSSLLPNEGGFIRPVRASTSACCCCTAASGSSTPGSPRIA